MGRKFKSIYWFRQDLRIGDNPALSAAVKAGDVYPIYILDDENARQWAMGGASRLWLHHSLERLKHSLGGNLSVYKGDAKSVLLELVQRLRITDVYWNRCYEPWRIARDKEIKTCLADHGVAAQSYKGSLLWEPWEISKGDGTPYRVFTPFYRNCLSNELLEILLSTPENPKYLHDVNSLELNDLNLVDFKKAWSQRLISSWDVGEQGAARTLKKYINTGLSNYDQGRDYPAQKGTSLLSPHLHFGEISPLVIWCQLSGDKVKKGREPFLRQLIWREFSYHLLYHFPNLPEDNFQPKFNQFSWNKSEANFDAWCQGLTGIPIIDAGLRELWNTGYMHNRVRMIVASYLTKNLGIDWREGAKWFWDTLIDADLANNSASWQWVAGSGADAAPFFRIFNPVTQSKKFDENADYICKYVPELSKLPLKRIFSPWEASDEELTEAGLRLGVDYPYPLVDLKGSREEALSKYKLMR